MQRKIDQQLLDEVAALARQAGNAIMHIYDNEEFIVEHKDDLSPLTQADKAAHDVIVAGLQELTPDIPIISEENAEHPDLTGDYFWLVDPLDGTKEFIKRNGEFTVNIGLIHKDKPVLGAVYVPAQDVMYSGAAGLGAFKTLSGKRETLKVAAKRHAPVVFAVSRSHLDDETTKFMEEFGEYETISTGSSIKMCLVAEGKADIYPRFAPTMEWDTAAGHAVVEAAGGKITLRNDKQFLYRKSGFKNSGFLATTPAIRGK